MHPNSLANLKKGTAPDEPGLGKGNSRVVPVRLSLEDIEAIASLGGACSYHIRIAVKKYLSDIDFEAQK